MLLEMSMKIDIYIRTIMGMKRMISIKSVVIMTMASINNAVMVIAFTGNNSPEIIVKENRKNNNNNNSNRRTIL